MYFSLIQKHGKPVVQYQCSSVALSYLGADPQEQIDTAPMRSFSSPYPYPHPSIGRSCSVLTAPQISMGWEAFCPSRDMSVPITCTLTPQGDSTYISKHTWLICTHRHLPCIYWEKPVLRAMAFHSLFPSALSVPLSNILQNSISPSVTLGIVKYKETKGMMLLMLVSDPSDGSLYVLDSLNQFCAITQVFSFANS